MQKVFKSKYPILEASMNRGSTLQLALAVHRAGGYASLCGWSYEKNWDLMAQEIKSFQKETGTNQIHISFELEELKEPKEIHDVVLGLEIPTVELIYGLKDLTIPQLKDYMRRFVKPMRDQGVKIFRRVNRPQTLQIMETHCLDGFMIKGQESAGVKGDWTVRDLFLEQQRLTPHALLIPYGGVGLPEQVTDYINLGAEIVGVGTVLAFSSDSPIKIEAKQFVVDRTSKDLKTYTHQFNKTEDLIGVRKLDRNALEFSAYQGPDPYQDENRTASLITGLYDQTRNDGHLMVGHSIDYVKSIRPVKEIIPELCSGINLAPLERFELP